MTTPSPERYSPVDIYAQKHALNGASYAGLGWASVQRQEARFTALTHDVTGGCKSVLDVGCGYGDLVPWVEEMDYTGIDIHEAAIEVATGVWGSPRAEFKVQDIRDIDREEKYDLVVGSGILSYYGAKDATEIMRAMWSVTSKVMGVNEQYAKLDDLLGIWVTLKELDIDKYEIRHSYLDDDITFIAWKDWDEDG